MLILKIIFKSLKGGKERMKITQLWTSLKKSYLIALKGGAVESLSHLHTNTHTFQKR